MTGDRNNRKDAPPIQVGRVYYALPRTAAVHLVPKGNLLDIPSHHALWFFLWCAHAAIKQIPEQLSLEENLDAQVDLVALARSIAQVVGVELDQMFNSEAWRRAQAEAKDCNLPIDPRITTFINSGGQANRHWDRDPDSHTKGQN